MASLRWAQADSDRALRIQGPGHESAGEWTAVAPTRMTGTALPCWHDWHGRALIALLARPSLARLTGTALP